MISPTIAVTCAHVAGARPSDPKHHLYHFKAARMLVNGIEARPIHLGEHMPVHEDIALLQTSVPIVPEELCFDIEYNNPLLYTVRPSKYTGTHIDIEHIFNQYEGRQ
jgi:hypothetical protein